MNMKVNPNFLMAAGYEVCIRSQSGQQLPLTISFVSFLRLTWLMLHSPTNTKHREAKAHLSSSFSCLIFSACTCLGQKSAFGFLCCCFYLHGFGIRFTSRNLIKVINRAHTGLDFVKTQNLAFTHLKVTVRCSSEHWLLAVSTPPVHTETMKRSLHNALTVNVSPHGPHSVKKKSETSIMLQPSELIKSSGSPPKFPLCYHRQGLPEEL